METSAYRELLISETRAMLGKLENQGHLIELPKDWEVSLSTPEIRKLCEDLKSLARTPG